MKHDLTTIDFAPKPLHFKANFKEMEREFYREATAHIKGRINKALYKMGLKTLIGINKPVAERVN